MRLQDGYKRGMNISIDPEHRSLYVRLKDSPSIESEEVAPGIVFDYDEAGTVIGIDVDDFSATK
jgi:uncharacterized protein YuzE